MARRRAALARGAAVAAARSRTRSAQVMTFLAENELSALYVPSRFVARVHPAFADVAQFLATQMMDESRHIDVFLRRARLHGAALGISSVTTSRSLLSLLDLEDFTEAAFLLSVLGEGTFLDLLRFVEEHAPDEAHGRAGAAHARRRVAPRALRQRSRAARARRRSHAGAPPRRCRSPSRGHAARRRRRARAHRRRAHAPRRAATTRRRRSRAGTRTFARCLTTMHEGRLKRLVHAGFSDEAGASALGAAHAQLHVRRLRAHRAALRIDHCLGRSAGRRASLSRPPS